MQEGENSQTMYGVIRCCVVKSVDTYYFGGVTLYPNQ